MPEICGEQREHSLYVFSLTIPGQETCHRERVPKIVEPWLIAGTIESQYPDLFSQPLELMVGMIVSDHHPYLCREDRRGALVPHTGAMSQSVKSQHLDEVLPDRHQPGLTKFGFPNDQCSIFEIRIGMLQATHLP